MEDSFSELLIIGGRFSLFLILARAFNVLTLLAIGDEMLTICLLFYSLSIYVGRI